MKACLLSANNTKTDDGLFQLPSPLDPAQVTRISAVHRGFLYQHLYGVACLLTIVRVNKTAIIIEHDEDIEFSSPDGHHYIQVKTRNRPLQPNDIADAMERIDLLREVHAAGRRSGVASFSLISNVKLGPTLANAVDADWPADVTLVFPGSKEGSLPPAWPTVDDAFRGGPRK